MDRPLLNDSNTYPNDSVLASVLGNSIEIYKTFAGSLSEYNIELEWHYYSDGKSWLGKAVSKKKTVFWLSVYQGCFKVSFHFTEKTRFGIMNLPIAVEIKTRIENAPIKGKLINLTIEVAGSTHLNDIFTLILYKQSCM